MIKRGTSTVIVITIFLILVVPFAGARFIQPDSRIPQQFNPQSFNRYAYTLNNPYKYIDPTGNIPVRSQAGDVGEVYNYIVSVEQENPALEANEVLTIVERTYRNYEKSPLSVQGSSSYSPNFIYTEQRGVVDQRHFFTNARLGSNPINRMALSVVQYGQEAAQVGWQQHSFFTYEDLVSNAVGREFGRQLNDKQPLSSQYKQFMDSLKPKPISPSLATKMPETEKGYKPSAGERKYTSSGQALPKEKGLIQRTVSKIVSFFKRGKK